MSEISGNPALASSPVLKAVSAVFLAFWALLAVFPLAWIAIMSVRLAIDAFAPNPFRVIAGPATLAQEGGVSLAGLLLTLAALVFAYRLIRNHAATWARRVAPGREALGWVIVSLGAALQLAIGFLVVLPWAVRIADTILGALPILDLLAKPLFGLTFAHYKTVWITDGFHRQFINTMTITAGVMAISLSIGTLAAYAFSRTPTRFAFWLLIIALIFRALPHSVLVAGYLPAFINSRELLTPLWLSPFFGPLLQLFAENPPTLYGQPWAVIFVLVAINQPFTIWLLRSFFISIPRELDEAAMVDGCTWFGAFRRVIVPVMWPGVITTGLFSFLLAYNDYLVAALLLDAQSQTMVPTISQYLNSENNATDLLRAIAAAVSITAPLFLLVLVFQRQIVAGLTAGAVKG